MPWDSWSFWQQESSKENPSPKQDDTKDATTRISEKLPSSPTTLLPNFTSETLFWCIGTAAAVYGGRKGYKRFARRTPSMLHLAPKDFRSRSFYGMVTRVGDGDNFHFFHTPLGRLAGWRWAWRRKPEDIVARAVKGKGKETIHIRVAGIDAPEMAHFGREEQPYAKEALSWLRSELNGKCVRVYPYRPDQYQRVVAGVYYYRWGFWKTDLSLQMLKRGLASVYEAKFGSEFGGKEELYKTTEAKAKKRQLGMWKEPGLMEKLIGGAGGKRETPREYKTRHAEAEKGKK
jgi:endonuclease YncB( thermonuclease family)